MKRLVVKREPGYELAEDGIWRHDGTVSYRVLTVSNAILPTVGRYLSQGDVEEFLADRGWTVRIRE